MASTRVKNKIRNKVRSLFTPGTLTTSSTVKKAMLRDLGARDAEFVELVRQVGDELLHLAGVTPDDGYVFVPMQGSGTYAVESVISSTSPIDGKLLVAVNGAYGHRMVQIARRYEVETELLTFPEDEPVSPAAIEKALQGDSWIQQVAVVHCETTTGILNPVEAIGKVVQRAHRSLLVDAISSFGGVPLHAKQIHADFVVSCPNHCLQGVPGFGFVLARREALEGALGLARTVALDLVSQYKGFEQNGQFRFTPPTHAVLALARALEELREEGGVKGRFQRYVQNARTLVKGMREIGFEPYLHPKLMAPIVTTWLEPHHPRFEFQDFYERLRDRGYVIYPGKLTHEDCFRIGTAGHLFPEDVERLLNAIRKVLGELGIDPRAVEPLDDS